MKTFLELNWNTGMALSELVSTMLLTLFVLLIMIRKISKEKFVVLFGLASLVSIVVGWAIGSWISGAGYGNSFITPITSIFMSFYYKAYNALWFIIIFQVLGTLIGSIIYKLLIVFNAVKKPKNEEIELPEVNTKTKVIKTIIFQPILVASLVLIPLLDHISYDTGVIINILLLIMSISLLLYFNAENGFLMFSPFLSLAVITIAFFEKRCSSKQFIHYAIELSIQLAFLFIFVGFNELIFKSKGGVY